MKPFAQEIQLAFEAGEPLFKDKQIEQAHCDVVKEVVAAAVAQDFPALSALMSADVTLEIFAPPKFPWRCKAHGVEEVTAAVKQNFSTVCDQQTQITTVTAQADTVAVFGAERGTIVGSGEHYYARFILNFKIRDGKVAAIDEVVATA